MNCVAGTWFGACVLFVVIFAEDGNTGSSICVQTVYEGLKPPPHPYSAFAIYDAVYVCRSLFVSHRVDIMSAAKGSSARKRPRSLSTDDDIRWMMSEADLADRHNWASMSACYFEEHLLDAILNDTYHMTLRARRSV